MARVPADVLERVRGRHVDLHFPAMRGDPECIVSTTLGRFAKFSLRTRDGDVATARRLHALAHLNKVFEAARSGPIRLTHKDSLALAGEVYALFVERFDKDPGPPELWEAWKGFTRAAREGRILTALPIQVGEAVDESAAAAAVFGEDLTAAINALPPSADRTALEVRCGRLAYWVLAKHGLEVDQASLARLLEHVAGACIQAGWVNKRKAQGDYTADPKASRFPLFQSAPSPSPSQPAALTALPSSSLTGLVADWWTERKAAGLKPSTHESYRNTMAALVDFLKHDDASRVSVDDVIRFKDHRLAAINPRTGKTISAKTVKDSDIAGLKAIFTWAVANRRMTFNPAETVTLKLAKARRVRSKGFTDAEARAILEAALKYQPGPGERPETTAAKRWVPWLSAYTGARVGELAQLRTQDLRQEGAHWLLTITPEAGTVKTNEAREMVLHSHLIELGFIDFVRQVPRGHLFLRPAKGGDVLGPLQGVKNRLAEFARAIVTDPNVAPNHGWRHRFKTVGMDAGIAPRVLDAIQGHAPRTAGDAYGDVTVRAMADAMARLPRYPDDQPERRAEQPPRLVPSRAETTRLTALIDPKC